MIVISSSNGFIRCCQSCVSISLSESFLLLRCTDSCPVHVLGRKAGGYLHQDHCKCALQAFERQTDALSRQLQRTGGEAQDLGHERQALLDRLSTAEQVSPAIGCMGTAFDGRRSGRL